MRVLGIIPARAGSKRVPGKNLRELGGKPLCVWAFDAARAATRLTTVVASSDDPRVLALATTHGVRAIARPPELATDTSPAIDYVRHVLGVLAGEGLVFDAIAIVQPSSPLTRGDDIDATIALCERTGADSAVSVVAVEHAIHPLKLKRLGADGRLTGWLDEERGRMAAHELDAVHVRNCAVYVTRVASIEAGQIIGDDCRGFEMPRERSVDVNEELDLAFAELLLGRRAP